MIYPQRLWDLTEGSRPATRDRSVMLSEDVPAAANFHGDRDILAAAHQLRQRSPRALDEGARDRRARRRPRRPLDLGADWLLRPPVAARRDAGQHPLQHRLRQRVAVGEVVVGGKPHLLSAVGAADARPLHPDATAAERHLAQLVPVPHGGALRVVLAPRADDLDHLFLEQLGQHPEPDADAQGEQPLLRRADQLPERLLHMLRQDDLFSARLGERYGALHGGSSLSIFRITRHAPKRSGREGGTADLRSSTSYGTTSAFNWLAASFEPTKGGSSTTRSALTKPTSDGVSSPSPLP